MLLFAGGLSLLHWPAGVAVALQLESAAAAALEHEVVQRDADLIAGAVVLALAWVYNYITLS